MLCLRRQIVVSFKRDYPDVGVGGRHDLSSDLDGNGEIYEHKWLKTILFFSIKTTLQVLQRLLFGNPPSCIT
jgi:hypothetical protein